MKHLHTMRKYGIMSMFIRVKTTEEIFLFYLPQEILMLSNFYDHFSELMGNSS